MRSRLERLIDRASERAYFAGMSDNRRRWLINMKRCQRLKAMRGAETEKRMDEERLARCQRRSAHA